MAELYETAHALYDISKELTRTAYNTVSVLAYDNQEIVAGAAAVLILGGSALLLRNKRRYWLRKARRLFNIRRGSQMNRKEYRKMQGIIAAEVITSALEDAIVEGRLKTSFVNMLYRQMAFIFDTKEFVPQRLPKSQRLTPEEYETIMALLFKKTPAPIPGPKPGQVDNVTVYSKSNTVVTKHKFGDKVRRRV